MNKYIYLVRISLGKCNPKHSYFLKNVGELGAIAIDYGGINNMCLLSSTQSPDTIHLLCTPKVKKSDVTVEEITKDTLDDESHFHYILKDKIENYYLKHDTYPNIEDNKDN